MLPYLVIDYLFVHVVFSFGGFSQWTFEQVKVTPAGNDRGGAWTLIDDIAVFQA